MNTDSTFKALVNEDVRASRRPELVDGADKLRDPENVRDWLDILIGMKSEVEFQLGANKNNHSLVEAKYQTDRIDDSVWLRELEDYVSKRNGSLRFKAGVELRITEAKSIVRDEEYYYEDED